MPDKHLIIITGPTGAGKTDLSIEIAKHYNSEIFSCDSRQFYKELEIGVAKPNELQLKTIKHHFINNVSIHQHYSISQYETEAIKKLDEYFLHNNIAIMCGGSGLYIDAICNGIDEMPDHDPKIRQEVINFYKNHGIEALRYELQKIDPQYYSEVDLKNPQRIMRGIEIYRMTGKPFSYFRTNVKMKRNFNVLKIGVNIDRENLYYKINQRVDKMIKSGLVEEARTLYQYKELVSLKTIGYREIFDYIENKTTLEEAIELIKRNTRHYARRQLTWFKKYNDINWISSNDMSTILLKYFH